MSAQDNLTLKLQNPQVNGDTVTYDVAVDDFTDMVAMQFSVIFPPEQLSFVTIENINLPDLEPTNLSNVDPGALRCVWLQPSLAGVTLDDNTVIFQIRFEMSLGTFGGVCFSEDPIGIEMVTRDAELASFMIQDDCHASPFRVFLNSTSIHDFESNIELFLDLKIQELDEIEFQLKTGRPLSFLLFDLQGRLIQDFGKKWYTAGYHSLDVNTELPAGMYVLHIASGIHRLPVKVLKF